MNGRDERKKWKGRNSNVKFTQCIKIIKIDRMDPTDNESVPNFSATFCMYAFAISVLAI